MILAAMQHGRRNTTRASASFLQAGDRVIEPVTIEPNSARPIVSRPEECVVRPARGSNDSAFIVFCINEAISIEVHSYRGGGGQC